LGRQAILHVYIFRISVEAITMTLQELQNQALNLPTNEKWQLLQTLLSAIQKDTMPPQTTPEKTYPLRGLPITISDDFDEPMPELWEALAE
jgi:hypothetical protein